MPDFALVMVLRLTVLERNIEVFRHAIEVVEIMSGRTDPDAAGQHDRYGASALKISWDNRLDALRRGVLSVRHPIRVG